MKLLFVLSVFFAITPAFGSAPESALRVRAEAGSVGYHVFELAGSFRLNDTFTAMTNFQQDHSNDAGTAGNLRAGLGAIVLPRLHARASLLDDLEPNSINGFGFGAGVDWIANPRDKATGEREIKLSLDLESTAYRQSGARSDPVLRLGERFLRREWRLMWTQELFTGLSAYAFGALDAYDNEKGNLLNSATYYRRRPVAYGTGTVAGFPRYSVGFGFQGRLADDWRLGADYSHSEVMYVATLSDTLSPELAWRAGNAWWLGARAAYARQQQMSNEISGGLTLTYEF